MKKLISALLAFMLLCSGLSAFADVAPDTAINWRGHSLRALFASSEYALVSVGYSLMPSNGGFVMVRFGCDGIIASELYEHRRDFVMLDAAGNELGSADIRVDGALLAADTPDDSVCYQFDAVFFWPTFDIYTYDMLSFEIHTDDAVRTLPISRLADRDYSLLDDAAPDGERDFSWALERTIGADDAFKLLFALCAVRADASAAYAEALERAAKLGISEDFDRLCAELVAAKLYHMPNDELADYLRENLLYTEAYSEDLYHMALIEAMDASDELLGALDDGNPQYFYTGALWDSAALEGFYGSDMANFKPEAPREGYYLVTVSPETQSTPNTVFNPDDESERGEALAYARDIVDYIDALLIGADYKLTGNPDIASVRLDINMQYISAGKYTGATGDIFAYNSALTLTAYDMTSGAEIAVLSANRSYGATISTYKTSGTIWCAAPDLVTAEGAQDFVAALLAHESNQSTAPVQTPAAPQVSRAQNVIAALGEPLYGEVYDYLSAGKAIGNGEKSAYAKGLQTLIVALGMDIVIDGHVGNKTIAAMNRVQAALGMDESAEIDAPGFERMLMCLYCMRDEDAAYDALVGGGMAEDEFTYICACGKQLQGKYYQAYERFRATAWQDAHMRAIKCAQPWPENGEIYRHEDYSDKKTHLIIEIAGQDDGYATLIKIYAENGELVSCLFVAGAGSVTAQIPGGTYTVKLGVGENWFELSDAFGREGHYETLLFDDDIDAVTLESDREYQLTINTVTSDPNADDVGSIYEDWGDF